MTTTSKIENSSSASSSSGNNYHTIIKSGTCSTLSGNSTLNYHIGCNGQVKGKLPQLGFRISSNDGGGYFSCEWIAFDDIQRLLTECPEETPITSTVLRELFKGKSVNTSAFLLAALKAEDLVSQVEGKKRHHQLNDPKPFMVEMKKLIAAKTDLKVEVPKEMIQRSGKQKQ